MKTIEERAKEYSKGHWDEPTAYEAYIAGAIEQKAIDEKVRLKKCDDMTKAEYDRETAFADWYLKNGKGTPTYSDAIEWARQDLLEKACEVGVLTDDDSIMETKFNFNSQICTTREQSECLLALGLRKGTADMTIHIKNDDGWYVTAEPFEEWEDDMNTIPSLEETEQILPAWSLNRLIELKQHNTIDNAVIILSREQTYDKLIGMIVKSIKGGKFPKEYLNGTTKDKE